MWRPITSQPLPTSLDPPHLSSAVFKKVDSISNDISSAQTYYEKKIVSIQEDLQGLGESLAPGPGGLLRALALRVPPAERTSAARCCQPRAEASPLLRSRGSPRAKTPLISQDFGEGRLYDPEGGVGGVGLFGELAAQRWQEQDEGGSWYRLVASGWLCGAHL